jgi:hypothetical protein
MQKYVNPLIKKAIKHYRYDEVISQDDTNIDFYSIASYMVTGE